MFDTTRSAPPPPSDEMTNVILTILVSCGPDYHAAEETISRVLTMIRGIHKMLSVLVLLLYLGILLLEA